MASTAAQLSIRERQIIKYISSGFTNEEIGNNLYISKETVKSHKHRLFRKTQSKECGKSSAPDSLFGILQ